MTIGKLNESPLHEALKDLYSVADARQEVAIERFVADVVHPDEVIYEIQTAGFGRMRRKLETLLETRRVVLVHPVVAVRYIHKLGGDPDTEIRPRRSPRRGRPADVLQELVSIPDLLAHPNFELEVVMVELDEFRVPGPVRRRAGWRVVERRLRDVLGRHRYRVPEDLFGLLAGVPPEPFSTRELALAMGAPRALAQKLAYCLRACGLIEPSGKTANTVLYQVRDPGGSGPRGSA
ncbi:MAG: hypothetical protein KF911_05470 [Pseudomonadales bacterium]|nr:hypothetical protein [Pseudomonadales bacterium]